LNTRNLSIADTSTTSLNKLFVGVDMAKDDFATAIGYQGQYTYCDKTANTAEACVAFADQLEASRQGFGALAIHLVIEPTGGYEQRLVGEAYRRGWLVTLVNPLDVRHWAKGRGKRAKTDRQDALMLAAYGTDRNPLAQEPTDEDAAELDSLLRRQADLEKLLRSERNRQAQIAVNPRTPRAVQESVKRTIEALEQELGHIDEAIKALCAGCEKIAQQLKQLCSVPSIGKKSAPQLLALLYRFQARTAGRGTAKQLVAYVGLDPQPFESGSSVFQRATISRQGDAAMRSMLFLCALGGVRGRNHLREIYTSLCARGKPKKVALIACARKALVWAWAVFTQGTTFDSARFVNA
jgi:transposase